MGYQLKFYTEIIVGYIEIKESDSSFFGYAFEQWKYIIDHLNITITDTVVGGVGASLGDYYSPTNGSGCLGYLLRNVSYEYGRISCFLANELLLRESDICMVTVLLQPEALQHIGYTSVTGECQIKMMSVHPIFEISQTLAFLSTFEKKIWVFYSLVLFISYLIWSVSLIAFTRIRSTLGGYNKYNLLNVIWNGLSVTLGNGLLLIPASSGERFGWIIFVLGSFWILTAFSGVLLSKLTLPRYFQYYETLTDLIKYPNCEVDIAEGGHMNTFFRIPKDDLIREIIKRNTLKYLSPMDFFLYIDGDFRIGKKVYIGVEEFSLMFFSKFKLMDAEYPIYFSKDPIKNSQYHFVFNRNLPKSFEKAFKNLALSILEMNVGSHILRTSVSREMDYNEKSFLDKEKESHKPELNLNRLAFAFMILLIGNAVSVVVAFIENYH